MSNLSDRSVQKMERKMLEAKDTVLNIEAIQSLIAGQIIDENYLYEDIYRLCKLVAEAQAEISFMVGSQAERKWWSG